MKVRCQIIVIYSYFETGSKPHKYVHKVYEDCILLTLYLHGRKNFSAKFKNSFCRKIPRISNVRHYNIFSFLHVEEHNIFL